MGTPLSMNRSNQAQGFGKTQPLREVSKSARKGLNEQQNDTTPFE